MRSAPPHARWKISTSAALLCVLFFCGNSASAQEVTLTGRVELQNSGSRGKVPEAANVVVWLTPMGGQAPAGAGGERFPPHPKLTQKNKSFEPHVLIVPVGASVEFPNRDPFFHNVFSLFEGKRFDLGLYEAGTSRDVHFDKPGISYIFCNIHPQMSAVVIALDTPYYSVSNQRGELTLANVPPGRYVLRVWSEASLPGTLKGLTREITVGDGAASLGVLRITTTSSPTAHKNKYDRDYDRPSPASPVYEQP